MGEEVPGLDIHAKFQRFGRKKVDLQPQKLLFFGINLLKGVYPLSNFYKILHGGSPRSAPLCQISPLQLKKCGLTAPKVVKNCNFFYKFSPKGKFLGPQKKVEYRCTTTDLPLCNDAITVLKITLHHSVSVITNFVIPKRDKRQKNRTFSSKASAQQMITILGMVIEDVRAIFATR